MKALATVKTKASSMRKKACGLMAGIMTAMMMLPVHATGGSGFGTQSANFTATDPKTMMNAILGLIIDIASYVGMAITVYGVIKIILAYKDDNANEISNGVRFAVVGLALVAIRFVLQGMKLIG